MQKGDDEELTHVPEPILLRLAEDDFQKYIDPPARGGKYNNKEFSHLCYVFSSVFASGFYDEKHQRTFSKVFQYWSSKIIKWQQELYKKLEDKSDYKKAFLNTQRDWVDLEKLNVDVIEPHPATVFGKSAYSLYRYDTYHKNSMCKARFSDFNEGDLFYKKEGWTYENVRTSFFWTLVKIDEDVTKKIERITPDLMNGKIPIREFKEKTMYGKEMNSLIVKKYGVQIGYSDERKWEDLFDNYVAGLAATAEPEIKNIKVAEAEKPKLFEGNTQVFPDYKILEDQKGFTKVGYRKDTFLSSPMLIGRQRNLRLPNKEKRNSVYVIVELENVLASHNEETFSSTENYPVDERGENINDRNYADDPNAQRMVDEVAKNFDPEIQISTSVSPTGLPVATVDGVMVSGNNRTMSLKRMVKYYPESFESYKKELAKEITCFGFDRLVGTSILMNESIPLEGSSFNEPKNIKFKYPVLMRIDLDFPDYVTGELAKYNKDTKKVKRAIDKVIEVGKILYQNPACFNSIANIVTGYENISDLYMNKEHIRQIQKFFVECNLLTSNEIPTYIDAGYFTSQGKEFLENVLAGMILSKEGILAGDIAGVKKMKNIIIVSLPVLVTNANFKEGSLKNYIDQAIKLQNRIVASGLGFVDFMAQPFLFEDDIENQDEKYDVKAYYLNRLLDKGRNAFKFALEMYNRSMKENEGESLFGDAKLTPEQVFRATVIEKIDPEYRAAIEKYLGSPTPESEIKPIADTVPELKVELPENAVQIIKSEQIKTRINSLVIAAKYETDSKKKSAINKRIAALTLSLKHMQQ